MLDDGSLNDPDGCLKLLKFVEHAKEYGLGVFKSTVETAIVSSMSP